LQTSNAPAGHHSFAAVLSLARSKAAALNGTHSLAGGSVTAGSGLGCSLSIVFVVHALVTPDPQRVVVFE
jgi:hypothetical protein